MTRSRVFVLAAVVVLIAAFFAFDLGRYFTLEALKAQQAAVAAYREAHPWIAAAAYFVLYVIVTSVSLPGAALLTLAGGAIFGLVWGTLLVSFASSLGATLAFLAVRFVFRDAVASRFGERIKVIDEGMKRDGAFYLFTLRLVPAFPFFLVNLAMGLTALPVRTFYWVSQVGMLAGTIVYVNAGTELAKIDSLASILSPALVVSFVLLGIFPLLAKKAVEWIRSRRAYSR